MSKIVKVADIITNTKIVLNIGSDDGASCGDIYQIFTLGKEIIDPDTGDALEKVEIIRGVGKVTHVQKKICTIDSNEFEKRQVTKRKNSAYNFSSNPEEITYVREQKPFEKIQIGDNAICIYKDDELPF